MTGLSLVARTIILTLAAGVLAGCAGSRIAPHKWEEDPADPRLAVRVPVSEEDPEALPHRERVHPNCRAEILGEIEWDDPRLACCPEEYEAEEFERNELSLFLGYTGVRAGDGTTIGLGYHRMLRRRLGVLAFAEFVFGESQIPVAGVGILLQPSEEFRIIVGAGAEFDNKGHSDTEALFRIGGMYKVWEFGRLEIAPAVYLDVVQNSEPVLLLGIEIGRKW